MNPPNHKNHMRSFREVDPKVHRMVINERLYDLASLYLDDSELRPAFFSSVDYLQAFPVGLYVSITSIKAADEETLRSIFKVPNGQASKLARTFIEQHPAFSVADKAKVLAAMKASVIRQGKDANTFWQLKSTVAVYGPHAVTYRLMNTRVTKQWGVRKHKTQERSMLAQGSDGELEGVLPEDDGSLDEVSSGDEVSLPAPKRRKTTKTVKTRKTS